MGERRPTRPGSCPISRQCSIAASSRNETSPTGSPASIAACIMSNSFDDSGNVGVCPQPSDIHAAVGTQERLHAARSQSKAR